MADSPADEPARETRDAVAQAQRGLGDGLDPDAHGHVVFGFDGYLDRVREVVADRSDPETYERLATLAGFGERVERSVAAESSLTFEWLQDGSRTGGHTCHLGRAFDTWGFETTLIGMYDDPIREPFDAEFGHLDLNSIGEPGVTDAVEFDDGKLMLTEIGDTMDLDWATLDERFGRDRFLDRLDGAALLGTGYWSETPDLPNIYDGLRDAWDRIDDPPATVLVDPGDVRKLDADGLRAGRTAIGRLDEATDVVVSSNRAETGVLADAYAGEGDRTFEESAEVAFEALGPTWFVGHGVDRSVVVTADGTHSVAVPAVDDPALTTSSGDHFNAGLAVGRVLDLDAAASIVVGNAVAGHFVRTADQPSPAEITTFVDDYLQKF
jgi:sugar/nucleoside kinase (ribokinase family)